MHYYEEKEIIFMKRKNVEAAREVRLWIGQIIVPGVTVLASALAIPEVRQAVAAKATELKLSIDQKVENLKKKNLSHMN